MVEDDVVVGDNVRIAYAMVLKNRMPVGIDTLVDSYVRSSQSNSIGGGTALRFGSRTARRAIDSTSPRTAEYAHSPHSGSPWNRTDAHRQQA